MFRFLKKLSRGVKTSQLLQELLVPRLLDSYVTSPNEKHALALTRILYTEALLQFDFNQIDYDGEELTRVGVVLAYNLKSLSRSRASRNVACAIRQTLDFVILQLKLADFDKSKVEEFELVRSEFHEIVDLGIDGFVS
jgi:hypothetical protein